MNINRKLDIFLITFNRAKSLDNTLEQILASNSPIKDFDITVIDNNSTDNTQSIIEKWQKTHSNLKYQKNKYNIGMNANITKAFYEAEKDYVWVLADNDYYHWESWAEVEKAIEADVDGIIVSTYENPKYDIAQTFLQTTFLPAVIYKTSNIDDTVMGNMQFNSSNLFPHLALSSKLINENKKFHIVDKEMVELGSNKDEAGKYVYTRGYADSCVHPLQNSINWIAGYANSLWMIKDKKIRNYIITHNRFCTELTSAKLFFWKPSEAKKHIYNYLCIFAILPWYYKLKFLIDVFLFFTLYKLLFIYKEEKFDKNTNYLNVQYRVRLFNFIKFKFLTIIKK